MREKIVSVLCSLSYKKIVNFKKYAPVPKYHTGMECIKPRSQISHAWTPLKWKEQIRHIRKASSDLFDEIIRSLNGFEVISVLRNDQFSSILYSVQHIWKDIRENRTGIAAYGPSVSTLIYNLYAWFLLFYYCRVYLRKLQFCKCVNHAE